MQLANLTNILSLAADLVNRSVTAVVTVGSTPDQVNTIKDIAKTIPVVFTTDQDPVAIGLVQSLSRPGGNLTGVTSFLSLLGQKRLGLLRELVPNAETVAVYQQAVRYRDAWRRLFRSP